jgi:NAD(P)-dependent dehydrogenase (short-subunit alcohol dehydrogenase family)
MRLDLPGRTVVITGASGGLGAGLARALRAHGANVALLDVDAEAVRQQAERLGGDRFARGWSIDVRDLEGLQQVMDEVAEHFGAIDVVIAGAGVLGTLETIDVTSGADWDRVIGINLNGAWRTLKAAAPHVAASQGHMVAVSSLIAYAHPPLLADVDAQVPPL